MLTDSRLFVVIKFCLETNSGILTENKARPWTGAYIMVFQQISMRELLLWQKFVTRKMVSGELFVKNMKFKCFWIIFFHPFHNSHPEHFLGNNNNRFSFTEIMLCELPPGSYLLTNK